MRWKGIDGGEGSGGCAWRRRRLKEERPAVPRRGGGGTGGLLPADASVNAIIVIGSIATPLLSGRREGGGEFDESANIRERVVISGR